MFDAVAPQMESAAATSDSTNPGSTMMSLATLLRIQPYISECKFHDGQFVLYDLNLFRQRFRAWNFSETLVEAHCRQFRVDPAVADVP